MMRTSKRSIKVSDVIAKALELLGPKGQYWITGDEHQRHGEEQQDTYCMIGALDAAATALCASSYVEQQAFVEVAKALPKPYLSSVDLNIVGRDKYTGQYVSTSDGAAEGARGIIPCFNDSLPDAETTYEDKQYNERFKRSRRPKGFRKVKKVFCKALKKTLAKDI